MCLKSHHYLKYNKSKNSAKYHKILMSRFWEMVFSVPLLFLPIFNSSSLNKLTIRPLKTEAIILRKQEYVGPTLPIKGIHSGDG